MTSSGNRARGCTGLELPMRSNFCRHNRPDPPPGHRRSRGGQSDAACGNGGFLLGSAHRCGVAFERVERAGNAIHDFIVAAARDSSEAAAADSRFAEIFLASALPTKTRTRFRPARW
jgi:hypothetical protein